MITRALFMVALVAVAADAPALAAQSSSPSQLRWYDAYDQGVAAVQKRDWKTAEQRLNEARTANPKQGRNVLAYGDRYVTYLPDYYLGIVYLNTNRSRQAEEAFGRISTQKLIATNNPEYKAFDQQSRQATFDRAFGEAVGLVAKGDFAQANGPLEQARATRIDDGKVNNLSAEIAKSASAKVAPPTTTPGPTTTPPLANAGSQVPASTVQTPIPNAATGNSTSAPGNISRGVPKAPENATVVNPGVNTRPPIAKIVPPVDKKLPTPQVSAALRGGMLAFFNGNYRAAMQQLDVAAREPGASARARAFLAFAKAGLVLTGGAGETLLREARADYQSTQALVDSDRRFISPKVLAVLEQTP
jgi:tetratricopeptide (TPR) repeat protein